MMGKAHFILLLLCVLLWNAESYRLNLPRVLLPYYPKNQVSYVLEVKEPDGGCFYWKSTRPSIVSVEALNTNGGCSDKALITARSRHSTEQSAVILATDAAGEISLSCDVRVDIIDRIQVGTPTGFLFIEGPPARITVNAFNSRGNEFTTLGSIPFEWTIRNLDNKSDRRPLRLVSFSESNYEVPFGIADLENQKKRGASVLVEGVQTGKASLTARIIDSDLENVKTSSVVELFVVQKAILVPSQDLFVPVGAIIDFGVVIVKQSGTEAVKLPSPQFRILVENNNVCKWDDKTSQIIALGIGTTKVTLIDTTFEEFSKEMFEYVRITVVQPDSIGFTVDRGDNFHFQLDLDYKINVKLRDAEGTDLTIPNNARFQTKFDSDHLKVLSASTNGTYFHVRAYKTGITHITSTFVEIVSKAKSSPFKVTGTQKIEINPPISVIPGVLVFPYDEKTQYEYKLKATGGSGHYAWTSENKKTALVYEDGRIRTGTLGESVIRAEDLRNPLHFGLSKVIVITPSEVGFGPSPVEAEIGSELKLNVKLLGHLNDENGALVPFTDCRLSDLRFGIKDPRYFELANDKVAEIPKENRGCRTVTLRALSSGDTKLTVWFGHLSATIDISAYPPLKISTNPALLLAPGSTLPVTYEGGPRPWLLDPTRYFSNLETANNEVAFIQQAQEHFNVYCREGVANTVLKVRVGNRPTTTNTLPAIATTEIQLCCAVPSRLALHPRHKPSRENLPSCPSSSLSIHCNMPAELELRGFGSCGVDSVEREFSSISSLLVDYKTPQTELAKVYAIEPADLDKLSAQVEPKGISGRLVIRASTNQFYSQGSKSPSHKHKLPETVSTELTLLLVNFVEAYPPRILLWNRPSAHTTIQLKGGSGHFYIDMSESGKNVNINYNDDGSSGTKSVELKPIRTSGNFKLPIYDLCIQHRLDVPIKVTELSGIEMDNAQFIELASHIARKIKLYDVDGEAFSLEDVGLTNLQVVLANHYFQVDKFDVADSAPSDDGKTLRVNLKYPGKSVFSVWPPEDSRLTKVFGLPAPNLTSTNVAQSSAPPQQHDPKQSYVQTKGQLEPTCSRRAGQLSIYNAYGFGVPDVLAEFFDRNLGLFIILMTISLTITAVCSLIWLCNRFPRSNAQPFNPNLSTYKSPNSLKNINRNSSSFINWSDTQKPRFYQTSTPGDTSY